MKKTFIAVRHGCQRGSQETQQTTEEGEVANVCINSITPFFLHAIHYFRIKAYRELNLVRVLYEDTRVSPFTSLLLHWARHLFLEIPPFISDPGNLLIFCEFLDVTYSSTANVTVAGSGLWSYHRPCTGTTLAVSGIPSLNSKNTPIWYTKIATTIRDKRMYYYSIHG